MRSEATAKTTAVGFASSSRSGCGAVKLPSFGGKERADTRLSMESPPCGEHGEPEKSLAEEKQEAGETESLRP
jgi:hypothetical protein